MKHLEWSDDVQDILEGDLTAAVAYPTPAGGAVVAAVSPVGLVDRAAATISFTTSMGFEKKLEHILRARRLAICFHTRTHGFSARPTLVLAQGTASVDLRPSARRLDDLMARQSRYLGDNKSGPLWDWILREYHRERVFVDIHVERMLTWTDLSASGTATVIGRSVADPPPSQIQPRNGTGPRADVAKIAKAMEKLPHRLLAFTGNDGYPVIVPATPTGWDSDGIRIQAPAGLPPGARRAGWMAHRYNAQCVGLSVQLGTGWLDVHGDTGRYAPHTVHTLTAPPLRTVQALGNGMLAKYGLRQARRRGIVRVLTDLAAEATPIS